MAQAPSSPPPLSDLPPLEHDDQILADETSVSPRATQKVALDLDDAPFLTEALPEEIQEEPAPGPPPPSEPQPLEPPPAVEKPIRPSRRIFWILGMVVALFLLAGGATLWVTRSTPPPPEPEPAPEPDEAPFYQEPPVRDDHFVEFDPFWVTYHQGDDVRFLSLKIALVTDEPTLQVEIRRKEIVLRDAAYYFLNNRPLPTVKRAEAAEALKQDLLSVFNQHLSRPLTGVLIEDYLVH